MPLEKTKISKGKLYGGLTLLLTLCVTVYIWSDVSRRSFLPLNKWFNADVYSESIGYDSVYCLRVELTEGEFVSVIRKLHLEQRDKLPNYEIYQPECKTGWWDIDMLEEATYFRLSENGSARLMASYKNGYLYYTSEVR